MLSRQRFDVRDYKTEHAGSSNGSHVYLFIFLPDVLKHIYVSSFFSKQFRETYFLQLKMIKDPVELPLALLVRHHKPPSFDENK